MSHFPDRHGLFLAAYSIQQRIDQQGLRRNPSRVYFLTNLDWLYVIPGRPSVPVARATVLKRLLL